MKKILTFAFILFLVKAKAQTLGGDIMCGEHNYYVRTTFNDVYVPVHDISTTNCPDGSVHTDTEEGEYMECKMELFLDAAYTQPVAVDPRFFSFAPSVPGSVGTQSNPSIIYRYECNAPLPAGSTYADNWRTDRTVIYVNQCIWECVGSGYYNCYPSGPGAPTNYNIVINCCYAPSLLAVQLTDFNGQRNSVINTLNWKLVDTTGFARLELERSIDGINFTVVYSTTNPNIDRYSEQTSTTSYYRLKVYSTNGAPLVSPIVVLKTVEFFSEKFIVSPSPFKDVLNVSVTAAGKMNAIFKLVAVSGQTMFQSERELKTGANHFVFTIPPVATGMYIMTMNNGNGTVAAKVLKQ